MKLLQPATTTSLIALLFLTSCTSEPIPNTPVANQSQNVDPTDYELGPFADMANADELEVLALHPYPYDENAPTATDETFHGYKVLGKSSIGMVEFLQLLQLIAQGESENDDVAAACFDPRHGIRVTMKDGSTQSLVICFACLQINHYENDERVENHLTSDRYKDQVTKIYESLGLKIHKGQ